MLILCLHRKWLFFPACSLYEFTKKLPELEVFAKDILVEFDLLYDLWVEDGFEKIRNEWLMVSYGLGKPVFQREQRTGLKFMAVF